MSKNQAIQKDMAFLLAKYADNQEMADMIKCHYRTRTVTMVENGSIDFDPDGLQETAHGENLTYNDYLDAQIRAIGKTHSGFQACFYNIPLEFKGCVEKVSEKHICFQRIYISGMYPDGTCFDDKEQHVWMELTGFELLKVGDCVSFCADTYRYLKTGNGKMIDYGIRNSINIRRIDRYSLPTDDELLDQVLDAIVCETCPLSDVCDGQNCMANYHQKAALKQDLKQHIRIDHESG